MMLFNEMGLEGPIVKAVEALGFREPTPVQEKMIPLVLQGQNAFSSGEEQAGHSEQGRDVIGLAQTGTGKTAAFGLPLVQMTDPQLRRVQTLVLCPTRELCIQITRDLKSFTAYKKGLDVIPVYGGASMETQVRGIKKGGQIVVGTPGRVKDLVGRGLLPVDEVRWLVLDEADEMLQMGFKEELDDILSGTPADKQTLLFSATMPAAIRRIANTYMNHPLEISVGTKNAGAENVEHAYYMTQTKHRYEALRRIVDMSSDMYGIVFCRTRRETREVSDRFMTDGFSAEALHGELSQAQRDQVMNRFRRKQVKVLVATDVAARGLDVNDLTHVINYNLPDDLEVYIHRSGRTGRAGKHGVSVSIISTREESRIRALEKMSGKRFERKRIPGGDEIYKKQLFNVANRLEHAPATDEAMESFMEEIGKKLEWLSREDLIRRFISLEMERSKAVSRNAPDLNVEAGRQRITRNGEPRKKQRKREFTRMYINTGSKSNLDPRSLIGLVTETTRNRQVEIGKIDIMKGFSFFEVDKEYETQVIDSFRRNVRFGNSRVRVELAGDR